MAYLANENHRILQETDLAFLSNMRSYSSSSPIFEPRDASHTSQQRFSLPQDQRGSSLDSQQRRRQYPDFQP